MQPGDLALEERVMVVEDLWDSIAAEVHSMPLTQEQRAELDKRLRAYQADGYFGRPAFDTIADIRRKL